MMSVTATIPLGPLSTTLQKQSLGGQFSMNHRKTTILTGTLLASILALALVASAAVITSGLVGRWIFDESSGITAFDSSGFGNNGTLSGAALFTSDLQRGRVLAISGISGMIGIPYNARLEPSRGTLSVWVKPNIASWGDIVQHPTDLLLRCPSQFGGIAYGIRVSNVGAPVAIFANDDPKTCAKSPQTILSGPANAVPLNKWTHIAARWDGGSVTLFANGKVAAKANYNPNPTYGLSYHGNGAVFVGTQPGGTLSYSGSVSDLRIYSRALSDTEISNIYLNQQ
jgi:concanavalin A-like lectin/glucanase superfamily protein